MKSLIKNQSQKKKKGQSLIELSFIVMVLLLLMTAMIEVAFLINQYIAVVDSAREGARYISGRIDPFVRKVQAADPETGEPACAAPFCRNDAFYNRIFEVVKTSLEPAIILSDEKNDDIVVSVFSVTGTTVKRFPAGGYMNHYGNRATRVTNTQITSKLSSSVPNTGLVVVEIFYGYQQILRLPILSFLSSDGSIPVYTYSIMPLSDAEPTATPRP